MTSIRVVPVGALAALALATAASAGDVTVSEHGKTPEGATADLFTLTNDNGITVTISEFGGTVTSIMTPDKAGTMADIVLGHDSLAPYIGRAQSPYFGGIIGRYANRIAKGQFSIGSDSYQVSVNNGENHLHGGNAGFDQHLWDGTTFSNGEGVGVIFTYTSPDGEEGYPGALSMRVTYTLTNADDLRIDYYAVTDKATVVNMTNHSYFNLSGNAARDILGHELMIPGHFITPTDGGGIPTGDLMGVAGTPFDFSTPNVIGARIDTDNEQIKAGIGYDHNWVLDDGSDALKLAAVLSDPESGRLLEIWTTEPGIQFYTGNYLDGSITGKGGAVYNHRFGLCLEPQHFPDSPNQPNFPSTLLEPGESYQTTSIYHFAVAG
jgi:aldose 1-epimerase